MAPKTAQDRSKMGPRSSWIDLFTSLFFTSTFDRFGIDFGAVLASQMGPQGCARSRLNSPVGVQDGPKIVLVRSFFRLVVRDRFFGRLGVVLGSLWGRFGALRGSFWCFFGSSTHRFNPSTHQLVDSTHQLINLSTHHPMALRHFLTRPGGLRAARLNKLNKYT